MSILKANINVTHKEMADVFSTVDALNTKLTSFLREGIVKHVKDSFVILSELEIERVLVISTAHISKAVDSHFHKITQESIIPSILVHDFEYGWIVYVPTNDDDFDEHIERIDNEATFDESFRKLFIFANSLNFNLIKFDVDGPVSSHFKQHDW